MQPEEIPRLIAEIALADPRVRRDDPTERRAMVNMWAGILADVPYAFAIRAAQEHYAKSPWPVLPADIASRWQAGVRDRMERHTDPTPAADPDQPQAWLDELRARRAAVASGRIAPTPAAIGPGPAAVTPILAGVARRIPKQAAEQIAAAVPGLARRHEDYPELAIACPVPTCRALPRGWCKTPSGKRLTHGTHPSRLDAWTVARFAPAAAQ